MSKKAKNYVLFIFSKYYGEKEWKWRSNYYSKEELVHRIALNETYTSSDKIIANLVDSMEDVEERYKNIYTQYSFFGSYYRGIPKYYIAKVNSGVMRKVEISELTDLINEEIIKIRVERDKDHNRRLAKQRCEEYTFREGPVPGVHNTKNWHRGCYYRHPLTTGTKRKNYYVDDEYKFNDSKIKRLPDVYDDLCRHTDKSWKTSYKVKKQWMKHMNKHVETLKLVDTDKWSEFESELNN